MDGILESVVPRLVLRDNAEIKRKFIMLIDVVYVMHSLFIDVDGRVATAHVYNYIALTSSILESEVKFFQ